MGWEKCCYPCKKKNWLKDSENIYFSQFFLISETWGFKHYIFLGEKFALITNEKKVSKGALKKQNRTVVGGSVFSPHLGSPGPGSVLGLYKVNGPLALNLGPHYDWYSLTGPLFAWFYLLEKDLCGQFLLSPLWEMSRGFIFLNDWSQEVNFDWLPFCFSTALWNCLFKQLSLAACAKLVAWPRMRDVNKKKKKSLLNLLPTSPFSKIVSGPRKEAITIIGVTLGAQSLTC